MISRAARGAIFAMLGLAVLAVSFLTWFRIDLLGSHATANAWQSSSLWQWAVVCASTGAVMGLVGSLTARHRRNLLVAAVLLEVVAIALWVRQESLLDDAVAGLIPTTVAINPSGGPVHAPAVVKDQLFGGYPGEAWASYAFLVLVVPIGAWAVVSLRGGRAATTD